MRIVSTDNFDGDYPDEKDVAVGIRSRETATVMCDALNARFSSDTSARYYIVVEDDYVLRPGFEP
jgi:hypothetical protein